MSELVVTLLRIGFLVLLWLFVLAALGVLRKDIFGTRVTPRGPGRNGSRHPRRPEKRAPARPEARDARPSAPERPVPRSAPTRLAVTAGKLTGTTLPLGSSAIVVGRAAGCTLVLDDDYSSSRHSRFFPSDGQWWVEDLGSTNGTFVGGARLTEPVPLGPGTPVRIGQTTLELRR